MRVPTRRSKALVALASVTALVSPLLIAPASGKIEGSVIRIGVLNDQSGQYSDSSGVGSVIAAKMAVEDFGGGVGGVPVEVLAADHQNKPDIGASLARRWYDQDGVDVIVDVPVSSVALAVQGVARQQKRLVLNQAATSDLSTKACSPYGTQWGSDTYTLSVGPIGSVVRSGQKSWFFLSADYAFGHALTRDASQAVQQAGGNVLGTIAAPLGTPDFSSYLLRTQGSGAQVLGLANAGGDMMNAIKQAREFGLTAGGLRIVSFLLYITDVHALGLETAQGLLASDSFYWDQSVESRKFARRFEKLKGKMPSTEQATVYASVIHYLKAVRDADSKDPDLVAEAMRRAPVDYFGRRAEVRKDGRVVFDLTLYRVKAPSESREPWDYYAKVADIPKEQAFRKLEDSECPLARQ